MVWKSARYVPAAGALMEARQGLREHVGFYGDDVLVLRKFDATSLDAYFALFHIVDELTGGLSCYSIVVDLEAVAGHPSAEARELLQERLSEEKQRIAHVGLVVSSNISSQKALVRFLFSFLSFSKFSFHTAVEEACVHCWEQLYH